MIQISSRIVGTGMNVPDRVVTNQHFASYLETSDEWIRERTGITERRWVEGNTSASELAVPACRNALKQADLTENDIDGIVFATVTPDYVFPGSGCTLQKHLGIRRGFAFDVNAVCSGFVYALVTADAMIARGLATNVLVVGADIFSRLVNPQDRTTCILFGDGAGAVVLQATKSGEKDRGILHSEIRSDGTGGDILCVPSGSANPVTPETLIKNEQYLTMAGREVFKLAVRSLGDVNKRVLEKVDQPVSAVKYFVTHQANKRILQSMASHLSVAEEKVPCNVEKYGNTSAASVPIMLAELSRDKKLSPGDLLVISAFGGGLTWGASVVRW